MDITAITSAYEGLKVGKGILKSLYDIKVESDVKDRVDDVLSKLGDAQDALFLMREELFKLQEENKNLRESQNNTKKWEEKIAEYELSSTEGGAVVYRYKGEPQHYACPSCTSLNKIEILQDNRTKSGKYRCVGCSAEFPIKPNTLKASVSFTNAEL